MLSCTRAIVCFHCFLKGLSKWLMCAVYYFIGHWSVFIRLWHYLFYIHNEICLLPGHNFVRLSARFSMLIFLWKGSAVGPKLEEHFNYNHSITTVFRSKRWIATREPGANACLQQHTIMLVFMLTEITCWCWGKNIFPDIIDACS